MALIRGFLSGFVRPVRYVDVIIMPRPSGDASMWGAELRVVREYLGLPIGWLADYLEVSERTIQRWENDVMIVPPGVGDAVRELQQFTREVVEAIAADAGGGKVLTYRSDDQQKIVEPVSGLVLPATWHRAVIARVLELVPRVTVDYARPASEQAELDARRAMSPHTCTR